jgi:glyoxylase-like metal-dependent hydrolase (beta-lactamase superfamily II)
MSKEIFKNTHLLEKGIFVIKSYFYNIYYTNTFIVKKNKNILIIDTGMLSSFSEIKKALEYLGYEKIFIINTHSHWDHIGSNYKLKKEFNCLTIGHLNGKENFTNPLCQWEKLFDKKDSNLKPTAEDKKLFFKEVNRGIFPDILLNNNEIINIDNNHYKIIHTPGHSSCSICVYDLTSKYLFSGDLLSGNGVSSDAGIFIDDDYDKYISSIELIKKLDIEKLFPSHFECKQEEGVKTFINNSLDELLGYKKIILSLIKESKKIVFIDLINRFVKATGKGGNLFFESSIKNILSSLLNSSVVGKEGDYYFLK